MAESGNKERKRGPVTIAELVGKTLDPLTAKRGFAVNQLTAGWADIVGQRYAACSAPERLTWPRGAANEGSAGMLVVRVDGPRALLFQHEIGQVIERVNAAIGPGTIDRIRIVQGPVRAVESRQTHVARPLDAADESRLASVLGEVESAELRLALDRLGRAVLAGRDKKS